MDSSVDPERVRAAVGAAVGAASAAEVEVRETHISWVFLTADRAYKLKKSLVLPFLDYGTPARRRRLCGEEVRLNRRLAPDIYVGVLALRATQDELELVGEGDPLAIDYLVEMRRFDEGQTSASVLARGELSRADVAGVGRTLAAFHAGVRALPCPRTRRTTFSARSIATSPSCSPSSSCAASASALLALWRVQSAFVAARGASLDARARRGLIRDGHGDLRAEHVLLGAVPAVVDCIEFDPALRALDVADDLAFLIMDLTALGDEPAAEQLLAAYRVAGGDAGADALVAFYACYRALVRAKVLLVRAAQLHPGAPLAATRTRRLGISSRSRSASRGARACRCSSSFAGFRPQGSRRSRRRWRRLRAWLTSART